jgi:hypothetical protein
MHRTVRATSWYELACQFVDMKWPRVAATTRRTHAEALTAVTPALLSDERGKPDDKLLRLALGRWAFNTNRRGTDDMPPDIRQALKWVEGHTRQVSALAKPEVLRPVLDGLTVRLDGRPAASSVVSRRRKIFHSVMEVRGGAATPGCQPAASAEVKAPKTAVAIDRRCVVNPLQARTLLQGVRDHRRVGQRLVAFYACIYYAGLRPEEAASLTERHLALPAEGWGEFHLDVAEPHAGKDWTDDGTNRDRRQLKQRARGESRTAPCPPELTALIHWHISTFGTGPDGRLFVGERNKKELPKGTINRIWREVRREVFSPDVAASPLAATPYDLRHAAVSTWLNGGVPPTQIAEWAGQSVEVLLRIYAKCLDGGVQLLRRRIDEALRP